MKATMNVSVEGLATKRERESKDGSATPCRRRRPFVEGEVQSAQDKMPKGRTGATAGQRAKKLTVKSTLEESGSLVLT